MEGRADIVLIGMPGCGKSTVGKRLSFLLRRGFLDLDKEIECYSGKTVTEIFAEQGEDGFRKMETEVLERSLQGGRVISAGGGIVVRRENKELLQNSIVVYLDRPLSLLKQKIKTETRPLLQTGTDALEQLWEQRKDAYGSWADIRVENTGSVEDAAQRIKQEVQKYENHRD